MRNWSIIAERLKKDGELISTVQAAKLIPAHRGRSKHASSHALNRWIVQGKGGVFLDGVKCGRGWATTPAAILRFLAACSEVEAGKPRPVMPEELREREQRASEARERIMQRFRKK